MPCGTKPVKKTWDKSRNITVVKNSKYEQNDPSVKAHWRNVIKELESLCKDDKFWESQASKVKELVEPHIFERLRKIFNLPQDLKKYTPRSASESVKPSEQFYHDVDIVDNLDVSPDSRRFSLSNFTSSVIIEQDEVDDEEWTTSSEDSERAIVKNKSMKSMKSSHYLLSKSIHKTRSKSVISTRMSVVDFQRSLNESTTTNDDLEVHVQKEQNVSKHHHNPHYELLYCSPTEMDMVTWNSNYFIRSSDISASDAVNKKAEIATKKIAKDFYEWWTSFGSDELKSEIRGPEDIEALFQVWFNEQASRGIVLDPRTLPCVLNSVATAAGVPLASCPNVLKRQVEYDIYTEKSPEHVTAFNTCLPQKLKHIPPKNDTAKLWDRAKIPEDLKSMGCVWDGITHLTSTKEFHKWLVKQPHMPMPPVLKSLGVAAGKKQRFVVPSGFLIRETSAASTTDLQFPVSIVSIELEEVLKTLMADI